MTVWHVVILILAPWWKEKEEKQTNTWVIVVRLPQDHVRPSLGRQPSWKADVLHPFICKLHLNEFSVLGVEQWAVWMNCPVTLVLLLVLKVFSCLKALIQSFFFCRGVCGGWTPTVAAIKSLMSLSDYWIHVLLFSWANVYKWTCFCSYRDEEVEALIIRPPPPQGLWVGELHRLLSPNTDNSSLGFSTALIVFLSSSALWSEGESDRRFSSAVTIGIITKKNLEQCAGFTSGKNH